MIGEAEEELQAAAKPRPSAKTHTGHAILHAIQASSTIPRTIKTQLHIAKHSARLVK